MCKRACLPIYSPHRPKVREWALISAALPSLAEEKGGGQDFFNDESLQDTAALPGSSQLRATVSSMIPSVVILYIKYLYPSWLILNYARHEGPVSTYLLTSQRHVYILHHCNIRVLSDDVVANWPKVWPQTAKGDNKMRSCQAKLGPNFMINFQKRPKCL
jgi:hypothetical protein